MKAIKELIGKPIKLIAGTTDISVCLIIEGEILEKKGKLLVIKGKEERDKEASIFIVNTSKTFYIKIIPTEK